MCDTLDINKQLCVHRMSPSQGHYFDISNQRNTLLSARSNRSDHLCISKTSNEKLPVNASQSDAAMNVFSESEQDVFSDECSQMPEDVFEPSPSTSQPTNTEQRSRSVQQSHKRSKKRKATLVAGSNSAQRPSLRCKRKSIHRSWSEGGTSDWNYDNDSLQSKGSISTSGISKPGNCSFTTNALAAALAYDANSTDFNQGIPSGLNPHSVKHHSRNAVCRSGSKSRSRVANRTDRLQQLAGHAPLNRSMSTPEAQIRRNRRSSSGYPKTMEEDARRCDMSLTEFEDILDLDRAEFKSYTMSISADVQQILKRARRKKQNARSQQRKRREEQSRVDRLRAEIMCLELELDLLKSFIPGPDCPWNARLSESRTSPCKTSAEGPCRNSKESNIVK
eukprot:gene6995-7626_t